LTARPHGGAASSGQYDLVIVGGGMVGASLAVALAATRRNIAVIEPVEPGVGGQPSFDDRTTALSNGSRRILETIGAWPLLAPHVTPIRSIHVSDAGHFGVTRLDAAEQRLDAMGYTVSNRFIGTALWELLRAQPGVTIFAPARVTAVTVSEASVHIELTGREGNAHGLQAQLAVAADGAQSLVRQAAGIAATTEDYKQVAVVASLTASRAADGVAFERFTVNGPIALLPQNAGNYTLVWTVATEAAPALLAATDTEFLARLQGAFGWRVGAFSRVGQRASYPLALSRAQRITAPRTALVGNAAQSLHPVAGQGFNLGLRDAAVLAELVAGAADAGDASLLAEFARRRAADRERMIGFTDGLVRLFALDQPGAASLRSLGLLLFDALPPAKRALSRVSWGFGSAAPRLLRGLPLT
jgi:2-octaprenyl-6-methoxyphenol hydroxylase